MMKLYVAERSGNSHKVQLFLSILGLAYETIELTYDETSLKSSMFLTRNPRGQVPFLDVEGQGIWDSQAILVYLARAHGGERWLPLDPFGMAEVMQWLALSENELLFGLAQLRIMRRYRKGNEPLVLTQMERAIGYAQRGLRVMEGRLAQHEWLALDRPTIAEMACFTYPALAGEAELDLEPYPALRAWLARVRSLPGFVAMPGM